MNRPLAPGVAEMLATTASAGPAAAPARFIGQASRSTAITLEWPVECDGVEYRDVVIKRMTTQEVADFVEGIASQAESARLRFPVYFHPNGHRVPDQVLDALDDDDMQKLNEVAEAFLPRRFQTALAGVSSSPNGGSTAP